MLNPWFEVAPLPGPALTMLPPRLPVTTGGEVQEQGSETSSDLEVRSEQEECPESKGAIMGVPPPQLAVGLRSDTDANESIEQIDEDIAVTQSQMNFTCPITQVEMQKPVRNKVCGHTYEEEAILKIIQRREQQKKKAWTQLRLESLEDTHIIKGEDDALSDKHGCPAYVSPEILNTTGTYSGKSADVWSLGVMLYTLLVGRYPFHDSDPSTLFSKIRRGQFCIPDHVSPKARCLIRSLLRREPSERLTAPEILLHPWFEAVLEPGYVDQDVGTSDQIVPEHHGDSDDISSFFC
ncbi:Tribbles like protein 1 [Chelonia mydas]|uniref:Tribbles like protein 1 n=1 Tax=Chelonia mydas TaxID=8469 RepID=M7C4S3_CHEMY|nr:Tribbles like protein 1 [Chelonia mydas]